jgi:ubiquinone/menaquinone biosynthesis C-methylase UbiE
MVQNKTVLDIGCGHGDFTIKWSPMVKKIVGLDITSHFIKTGRNSKLCNVSFVTSNTKDKLPFANGEFDCAYNRKGPTSAYRDLKRIMKKGGKILSLHPGDHLSPELTQLFHNLFDSLPKGTPVLDKIQDNLEKGMLTQANIETVASVTYIHEPIDIVKLCCFGQTPSVHEMVINESMPEIERIFYEHATENGLRTTGRAYIVRTTV